MTKGIWRIGTLTLALAVCSADTAAAQSSGIERALERAGRAVERAMRGMGEALDRALDLGDYEPEWSQAAESFEWTGRIEAGRILEVKGVNGPIEVELADGDEIEITAQARGRRSDPSTVRIEMVEHDEGLTFCAVYPSRGNRENYCAPGSRGRMNTSRNDVQVRFVVRLPRDVNFAGRTVNGDVEALGLASDVTLKTVNGDVEVSTSGYAEASTVNGSITAAMGRMDVENGLNFETVNGSIDLDLPDDADADLDVSWVNGGLDSELPFRIQGRISRRHAQGLLGDGGPPLTVSTVNGSIRVY